MVDVSACEEMQGPRLMKDLSLSLALLLCPRACVVELWVTKRIPFAVKLKRTHLLLTPW